MSSGDLNDWIVDPPIPDGEIRLDSSRRPFPLPDADFLPLRFDPTRVVEWLVATYHLALASCPDLPLTSIDSVPETCGIFALHHKGKLTYLGSADQTLRGRLGKQRTVVVQAEAISLADVTYRYAVYKCTLVKTVEKRLCEFYRPIWNEIGYGPGPQNKPAPKRRSK